MPKTLELIPLEGFPRVEPGDDLSGLIMDALAHNKLALAADDVLVLAQKIVSKAEGRYVSLADVVPGERALQLTQQADNDPRQA